MILQSGFVFLFRRTGERTAGPRELFLVTVEAMDHPGIVHGVTSFFSDRRINICELSTETARAAHTGAPVFNLQMEIELSAGESIKSVEEAFQVFCQQEGLDGHLGTPKRLA